MLRTPAIVLEGAHLAKKPSYSHLGSITWTVWPSGLRRWLKAPCRKGVVSNPPLSFLHTKQIGAGGPKPRHHSFLSASGRV